MPSESSSAPVDATPLNVAPSYMIVPFDEDYVIPKQDDEMEDTRSRASTPMDEEIQIDDIPQINTPPMTTEEKEGDEETGCSTPVIHDEFWEETHPNSPRIAQIPQTLAATEILTGFDEKSIHEESAQESATSAEENVASKTETASSNKQVPQNEENAQTEENAPSPNVETAIVVVNPETAIVVASNPQEHNLQPKPHRPFTKRPKFQKEAFYEERQYFTGENPYDKLCIRHRKFWTRNQLNYYASVLCGRKKIWRK
ncbi:hypothetical protein ZWY2020_041063 [Hordeum vulgare]|nr:hypothetical protein ZWY2020_041063 [Hordeum vulgare]